MGTVVLFTLLAILLTGVAAVLAVGAMSIGFGMVNVLQARLGAPSPVRPAHAG